MIQQSFTLRVLVISFLVLALPLLVTSFIFFQDSYHNTVEEGKIDLQEAARLRTLILSEIQPVDQVFLSEIIYLLNLKESEDFVNSDKLNRDLAAIAHIGEGFQICLLSMEKEGSKVVASSMRSFDEHIFMHYLKSHQNLKTSQGTHMLYIYSPVAARFIPYIFMKKVVVSEKTGESTGFILVVADIEDQLKSVVSINDDRDNVKFALLNADGIVIASTDNHLQNKSFDPLSVKRHEEIATINQIDVNTLPFSSVPIVKANDLPFFEFSHEGQVQIAYRAYYSGFGISVIAYSPKKEFFGVAIRHFFFIYSVYGLILVLGGGITYWLSLWVSRPLLQLSRLMGEVSQGNLNIRFEKEPLGFEINILGKTFNNTLIKLLKNIQQAEDERVKKETYQKEIAIGRQVQQILLPSKEPEIHGVQIAGAYLPALEAGGDFYSYIPRVIEKEESVIITVVDVPGKGISACLYALFIRSLFVTYATFIDDLGEILCRTKNAFIEGTGDTEVMMTLFAGHYHAQSKILSYCSCGHVAPIVCQNDGHLITLESSGVALGLKKSQTFVSNTIQLQSGDLVIFYTNGLLKAISEKRLRNYMRDRKWESAQEAVEGLIAELQPSTGDTFLEEVIIVALKVD